MQISRRWLMLIFVGCLCITAGCNSLFNDSDPQTTTTSDLQGELAPGLTAHGVTDVGMLTETHARILQEDSYTVDWANVQRYSNGTVRYQSAGQTRRGAKGVHFYSQIRYPTPLPTFASFPLQRYETYGEHYTIYLRYLGQNNTTTRALDRSEAPVSKTFTSREYLYAALNAFNKTHGFTATKLSNSSPFRYRIRLTKLERPALIANYHALESVTNASLTATTDGWGVIHQYRLTYTGQANNRTVSGNKTIQFTQLGSTHVSQPFWVQNVSLNQSTTMKRNH